MLGKNRASCVIRSQSGDNSGATAIVDQLYESLAAFRTRSIDVDNFCAQFASVYPRSDKSLLTDVEKQCFDFLFERVVWYSPLPEISSSSSSRLGGDEIRRAVEDVAASLDSIIRAHSAHSRLVLLLERFGAGQLDAASFCSQYERTYNLELNKTELSSAELGVFDDVFDRVVWYSPFAEEREKIPQYIDEQTLRGSVENAIRTLKGPELG